jgi:hypothetical protein
MPRKPRKQAASARRRSSKRRGVSFDDVRTLALALPGSEEGSSYGTPAWRVRGKLFARIHDSGEALVVRVDLDERELAMAADPETFYITDHYRDHPMMLVRLDHVTRALLADVIAGSWRRMAPKRLLALHAATP